MTGIVERIITEPDGRFRHARVRGEDGRSYYLPPDEIVGADRLAGFEVVAFTDDRVRDPRGPVARGAEVIEAAAWAARGFRGVTLECKECKQPFRLTPVDVHNWRSLAARQPTLEWTLPRRCRPCRTFRREHPEPC